MSDDEGAPDRPPRLPPLREVVARHRLSARKALGQNFLFDRNLIARIARAAGDLSGQAVIEIGAGPGGLTRALLAGPAREVIAVERDERCIAALDELAAAYPGRLRVVAGDALAIDAAALAPPPRAIVANLPYNIATPLLVEWLAEASAFTSLTLMFQKEVAERILAPPGGRAYGRLSVFCQWRCEVARAFDIDPHAGIAIDVTHASDYPGSDKITCGEVTLGKGPVLHRGANMNSVLSEMMVNTAKKRRIPYQFTGEPRSTGTDANVIQINRAGVAATLVSIPNRYMHTPVEVVNLKDLDNAIRLLTEYVLSLKPTDRFIPGISKPTGIRRK